MSVWFQNVQAPPLSRYFVFTDWMDRKSVTVLNEYRMLERETEEREPERDTENKSEDNNKF